MNSIIENLNKDVASKLAEIYVALEEIEQLRFSENITKEEQTQLERVAIDLRGEERKLLKAISKEIADRIAQSSISIELLAKEVRKRSTKLSKTAKGVDKVTKAITVLVDIIERTNKQLSLN